MRLNNKGFAITSILYSILIMAIMLILGVLFALSNRKVVFDKLKSDIQKNLNDGLTLSLAKITVDSYLVQIDKSDAYDILAGVTATEIKNGVITDLTASILYRIFDSNGVDVTQDFNTDMIGSYTIRYDVLDSNNNMAPTKTRILIIAVVD